ncbi:MAG: extracellular solute-binding protein [Actinomycetota bacterium]
MRTRLFLSAVTVSGVTLAACGGDDGETVTIYSGRTENLIQPILDDFSDETGIDVEVRYGGSADLALLIEEEAAAGDAKADVFLSQSPGSIELLDQNGRLGELPASTLDLVPDNLRDTDGRWIGFSGRQRVLVYNQDLVDPAELPTSVFELTEPRWQGRIGLAPGNGSFQDFVTAMRATEGDDAVAEWLSGLNDNGAESYPNNNAIVAAVGRGEVDAGLVNHYYNFRFLAEDGSHPGRNHLFDTDDPGAVLIITGAGVVEGTDKPDEAAQLIEFLLGSSGQQYFAEETFEYPLANGEQPAGDVPVVEFGEIGAIDYDQLGGGLEGTRTLITDAGFEG